MESADFYFNNYDDTIYKQRFVNMHSKRKDENNAKQTKTVFIKIYNFTII